MSYLLAFLLGVELTLLAVVAQMIHEALEGDQDDQE